MVFRRFGPVSIMISLGYYAASSFLFLSSPSLSILCHVRYVYAIMYFFVFCHVLMIYFMFIFSSYHICMQSISFLPSFPFLFFLLSLLCTYNIFLVTG